MKAILLHGKNDLRIADLAKPEPRPWEVLIAIRRAGICGSDVHYFAHGHAGSIVPKHPFVLGHEFAGEVVALGSNVGSHVLGRRVVVDPSMPCGICPQCRSGNYNLCESMRFFGSASCDPHVDGGFSEYVTAPAANCFVFGDEVGWGEAAMIEPLSVALHAIKRAGSVGGKTALVTGGGAIGQLVALALRAYGARLVVLSDLDQFSRDIATAGGADAALNAADPSFNQSVRSLTGSGFNLVFEASGSNQALEQALVSAHLGATIVQIGTLPKLTSLPLNLLMQRELNLVGSFRFANVFGTALELVKSGRINLKPLITSVHPLLESGKAMRLAVEKVNSIKVQFQP
jgi:L-idonate 5-dehydrogenase